MGCFGVGFGIGFMMFGLILSWFWIDFKSRLSIVEMGCGGGGGSDGWAVGGLVEVEEREGERVSSVRKCVRWEREKIIN